MNHDYRRSEWRLHSVHYMQLLTYDLHAASQAWPRWAGGLAGWMQGCPPQANMLAFRQQMNELRHATMLEF